MEPTHSSSSRQIKTSRITRHIAKTHPLCSNPQDGRAIRKARWHNRRHRTASRAEGVFANDNSETNDSLSPDQACQQRRLFIHQQGLLFSRHHMGQHDGPGFTGRFATVPLPAGRFVEASAARPGSGQPSLDLAHVASSRPFEDRSRFRDLGRVQEPDTYRPPPRVQHLLQRDSDAPNARSDAIFRWLGAERRPDQSFDSGPSFRRVECAGRCGEPRVQRVGVPPDAADDQLQ